MEPTIVTGVGVIVASKNKSHAKRLEAAIQQAILDAMAEGITDAQEIRRRIIAVKDSFNG